MIKLHQAMDKNTSEQTVEDGVKFLISKVQENCKLGRVYQRKLEENQVFGSYLHNKVSTEIGKIGSVVLLQAGKKIDKAREGATQVAMHASAMNPIYLNAAAVPEAVKQGELQESDKKWNKYVKDYCLEEQEFCLGEKQSVKQWLQMHGGGSSVKEFCLISFQ
eukprot:NODE_1951_length_1027_cov_75.643149_g1584_i0.p1 GENE.NODE_1951_length_1027_cov_75.643149_g1584_i0~~NODE_1951_length_1027_cov_75.643149_g1584_i0.p1  ORF type:complete len:163 (+),score=42.45 NODE_1951_length_1027_cov_75.643149_g1584_i0:471-959(+)